MNVSAFATDGQAYVLSGDARVLSWISQGFGKEGWTDEPTTSIWWSHDGVSWQAATLPAEPGIGLFQTIISTPTGFAALGPAISGDAEATHVMVSTDGREWQYAGSFPGEGTDLVEIDGRFVAFGDVDWLAHPWYSDDGGVTWLPLETESAMAVADGLIALQNADGYLWAIRSDDPVEDASIRNPVELWRTANGLDWMPVVELPGSISVNHAATTVGPNGWVISARRVTFNGAGEQENGWFAWRSADGLSWQPAEIAPRYVDMIVADERGFIAIGSEFHCCAYEESDVRQHIWVSADGSVWEQLNQNGWHGRQIDFITNVGELVTGVGIDWRLAPDGTFLLPGWGVGWTVDRAELAP